MTSAKSKPTSIIGLASLGTATAVLIGVLIWYDNRIGFRDAGNFANLFAAIFSMIATIWLVATVIGQSQELRLQREELSLQREQTTRIADDTGFQNKILESQILIQYRTLLISQIKTILISEQKAFITDYDQIRSLCRNAISNKYSISLNDNMFFVDPFDGNLFVKIYDRHLKEFLAVKDRGSVDLPYNQLRVSANNFRYRALTEIILENEKHGDLDWFRHQLPFAVGATGNLSLKAIAIILNFAAFKALQS